MKTATYKLLDGSDFTVEYDETAPCRLCGLPVGSASMPGTDICPACDCGYNRCPKCGEISVPPWKHRVTKFYQATGQIDALDEDAAWAVRGWLEARRNRLTRFEAKTLESTAMLILNIGLAKSKEE